MKLKRKQKRTLRDILVAAALFLVLLVVHHLTPELWWLHLLLALPPLSPAAAGTPRISCGTARSRIWRMS